MFEKVLQSSSKCKRLIFSGCAIDLPLSLDFSMCECSITYLALRKISYKSSSNWKSDPNKLQIIINAISKCSLKDSLETLDVFGIKMETKKIEEMLKEVGLEKVKVVMQDGESSNL